MDVEKIVTLDGFGVRADPREHFVKKSKDLGHFWLGYIRMLGHLQLSAHLPNFDLDIGTMPIESDPHPLNKMVKSLQTFEVVADPA